MNPESRSFLLAREPSSGRALAWSWMVLVAMSFLFSGCPNDVVAEATMPLISCSPRILAEQGADRFIVVDPVDRFAEQLGHAQGHHAILDAVKPVADGDRVGYGQFRELALAQTFDRRRREDRVRGG